MASTRRHGYLPLGVRAGPGRAEADATRLAQATSIVSGASDPHPSQHEVDGSQAHLLERGLE